MAVPWDFGSLFLREFEASIVNPALASRVLKNEPMIEASLSEGTAVGRYRIRDLLGAGGMGEVYRAWEASLDRLVALKILRPELTGDAYRVERFVTEARAASALNHPAIVSIYEIGDERSDPGREAFHYIAMELVEGVTLDEWMRQAPPLGSLLGQLATVAEGLAKAHERGIIHRDLKPENIMITPEGHPKVLDFGVAKLIDVETRGRDAELASRATVTEARSLVGTAEYMSPEQIEGTAVDHRSDIFSFGCVVYECLTGRSPFGGAGKAETLHNVVHREPAALELGSGAAASALQRIVDRCLAKDRERRYDSARDLALDLREAGAMVSRRRRPRRLFRAHPGRRSRAILAGVAVLVAAVLLVEPAAGVVSTLAAAIAPARHPQFQKLEKLLGIEADRSQSLAAALSEREGEVARRSAEIERLKADLEHSERLRSDLEASYRTLLSDVEEHLRRNNTERSELGTRAASAENELQRVRQQLESRTAQQARLGLIQQELSPIVDTRLEARGLVLRVPGIFRHSRSRIEPAAFGFLQRLADQLTAHPEIRVAIEGHTDSSGSGADNLELSQERADRVGDHLVMLGIDPARISTVGRGEMFPAFSEMTPEGQQANRRIEVILSH